MAKRNTYQTIGAISGHFPKRAKTPKKLSADEISGIVGHLATAAARGMDAAATRTFVAERMAFDFPTAPWFQVEAEMNKILEGK